MIVDWLIGEGLSYSQIRDQLNELKIPNPNVKLWINSSISQMFREDRLMQYTGYGYWNRAVKPGTIGKTHKNKSEWVIVENAHPAIITKEEAESAFAVGAIRKPRTAAVSSFNSQWALTGHNLEGKPFFTCNCCGGNMSGHNDPRGGRYICTNYHYRGKGACTNNKGIKRDIIEPDLLSQIEKLFGTPQAIETLVADLNSKLSGELKNHDQSIKEIEKEIQKN
jgi:site-specific DNA recombinase